MIVFLTLCYVGVLAIAVKMGVIKLNLWWKLSPVAWMLLLFLVLFLPMQWGAPGGSVSCVQYVVEIVPNVTGEVVEVPVKGLEPLEPGDPLFVIDATPFQSEVDRLRADLAAAVQGVKQLEASSAAAAAAVTQTIEQADIKRTEQVEAAARVTAAEAALKQAASTHKKTISVAADLEVQVAAAGRELERKKSLLAQNAASKSEVDLIQVQYTGLDSQWSTAKIDIDVAEQGLVKSRADKDAAAARSRGVDIELKQLTDSELPRVKAIAREAKLAAESFIGDEHTTVANVRAQLNKAEYDLEQTTVRAPAKGHVVAATLRPGQRVSSMPMRSWMAFVDDERTELVVAVHQYALRHVEPGQAAEVTLKIYPGKVFPARVDRIAYSTSGGQLQPSGQLPSIVGESEALPYGVILKLEDQSIDSIRVAGGAVGTAAIYTNTMKATHVIRRVMMRMDAWMNYIIPS